MRLPACGGSVCNYNIIIMDSHNIMFIILAVFIALSSIATVVTKSISETPSGASLRSSSHTNPHDSAMQNLKSG